MRRFPYTIDTRVDGKSIGVQQVEDPFHTTTVVIGWWDRFKSLFSIKGYKVVVSLDADFDCCMLVSEVNERLDPYPRRVQKTVEGAYCNE